MYTIKNFKDGQVSAKMIERGNLHVKIRGNTMRIYLKLLL